MQMYQNCKKGRTTRTEQWGMKMQRMKHISDRCVYTVHFVHFFTPTQTHSGSEWWQYELFYTPFFWHIKFETEKRLRCLVRACNANFQIQISQRKFIYRMHVRAKESEKQNGSGCNVVSISISIPKSPLADSNLMPVNRAQMMMMVIWFGENTALITHAINICLRNISHIFYGFFFCNIRWKSVKTFQALFSRFLNKETKNRRV